MGGLGLRSTEQHSPAAFLASQLACRNLCSKLDRHYTQDQDSTQANITSAIESVNTKVKQDQQLQGNLEIHPRQQVLSQVIDSFTLDTIREGASNKVRFQAHINHTTASGAGSWLHAVPSEALRTHSYLGR